jgi:GNAT superfamily N-acetyltransferase
MKTIRQNVSSKGIKFSIFRDEIIIGRATLYLMNNDLHDRPFGLLEDVYVDKASRKLGVGTTLVQTIIEEAKAQNCYKLSNCSP